MPAFSNRSKTKLQSCDERLQRVLEEAIKHVDFTVLEGYRDNGTQTMYFEQGRSKVEFPNSKHNSYPSMAVDIAPYPINWNDVERFRAVAFFIKGIAAGMGIKLRLGADWDGDFSHLDQSFHDMPHIEILDE